MANRPNEDVLAVARRIQALPVVVANLAALEGDDLPCLVAVGLHDGAPQGDVNTDVAFVADSESALLTRLSISHVDRARLTNIENNTDHIDSVCLDQLFNPVQPSEREADTLNAIVVLALLDDRMVRKGQTVVVLDRGEALVGELDHAVGESVNTIKLQQVVEERRLLVESRALDLRALNVDQIKVDELAAASVVFPRLDGGLLHDARLNRPVVRELVE